jgi:hypothetical protein
VETTIERLTSFSCTGNKRGVRFIYVLKNLCLLTEAVLRIWARMDMAGVG